MMKNGNNIDKKVEDSAIVVTGLLVILSLLFVSIVFSPAIAWGQSINELESLIPTAIPNATVISGLVTGTIDPVYNIQMPKLEISNMTDMELSMLEKTQMDAKKFAMAQDVTWLVGGEWIIASGKSGNNTLFSAQFVKVTLDGKMLHTHTVTNFTTNESFPDFTKGASFSIGGNSSVYFNDALAWKSVPTTLSVINGTILIIDFDSDRIDDHFHGQQIRGIVNSITSDGIPISSPKPDLTNAIQEEFNRFQTEAIRTSSNISDIARETGDAIIEETSYIISNLTKSILGLLR